MTLMTLGAVCPIAFSLVFRRSSALAAGLGWSSPLSGKVLGTQLLSLGRMHPVPSSSASSDGDPPTSDGAAAAVAAGEEARAGRGGEAMAQQLAEVVPQLYR